MAATGDSTAIRYKSNEESKPRTTLACTPSVTWVASSELGYALDSSDATAPPVTSTTDKNDDDDDEATGAAVVAATETASAIPPLFCCRCRKAGSPDGPSSLRQCARCRSVWYCSKECQASDWKGRHKRACDSYRALTVDEGGYLALRNGADRDAIRTGVFVKIRLYACPYAVHQSRTLGRGLLFVQCTVTLATMSLGIPVSMSGEPLKERRSLLVHFLTLGEFDVEVCREDFELATLRPQLSDAIERYDPDKEVVLLLRFRCGHLAVGIASLVPEHSVCVRLGQEYFGVHGTDPLQLDVDDC
jgi:hypothetical protein